MIYYGNAKAKFKMNNEKYDEKFRIVDKMENDAILGLHFLFKHKAVLDTEK